MVGQLVTLISGMAVGILLMVVLERPTESSDEAMMTLTTPSRSDQLSEPDAEVDDNLNVDVQSALPADELSSVDDPVGIPNSYRRLIGPVAPRDLSFPELHALFEKEPREEAWAYAMETGINNHIAIYGAGEGVVVEYVECRQQKPRHNSR